MSKSITTLPVEDIPYHLLTDQALIEEHKKWENLVGQAGGWSSAYFAARQVEEIVSEGKKRGLGLINHYPIKVG